MTALRPLDLLLYLVIFYILVKETHLKAITRNNIKAFQIRTPREEGQLPPVFLTPEVASRHYHVWTADRGWGVLLLWHQVWSMDLLPRVVGSVAKVWVMRLSRESDCSFLCWVVILLPHHRGFHYSCCLSFSLILLWASSIKCRRIILFMKSC